MTREERIQEMMSKPIFRNWSRKDVEDELSQWTDEEVSNGYMVVDFDGTGMLEIEAICSMDAFDCNDELAVIEAVEHGIKLIPVEELPENFDRRYLGWLDTPENRKCISEYCLAEKICTYA